MNKILPALALLGLATLEHASADPALTIYNQDFAVVRDTVPLDLKQGENRVPYSGMTAHLEPDSVILRDPAGKVKLQVLEQNYRNDPVSQELLLSLFEGKTIDFLVKEEGKPDVTLQGKIIRSGYVGYSPDAQPYRPPVSSQPIIEVDGKPRFGLPGQPIFPSLGDDTILKPMISWKIFADHPGKFDAELAYITGDMSWEASYNLVSPEKGDEIDLVGWITMNNQTGKTFENARIKLIAGDVNKIQRYSRNMTISDAVSALSAPMGAPAVTEKSFDEYHLYTLPLPATLYDNETKQVEFVHATGIKSERVYVYDGARQSYYGPMDGFQSNSEFGVDSDTKVSVLREFKNSKENNLGLALPKGRIRFYREDDSQLQFTGENVIDHTPTDEMLRIYTGNAFDLVGERRRTNFKVSEANHWADESFEIKVRNHKTEPVNIRVVEHLFRWTNWEITAKSDEFTKTNAQEIKFTVPVKPNGEKVITYTVHYSW